MKALGLLKGSLSVDLVQSCLLDASFSLSNITGLLFIVFQIINNMNNDGYKAIPPVDSTCLVVHKGIESQKSVI